jgi:hypothetical protein
MQRFVWLVGLPLVLGMLLVLPAHAFIFFGQTIPPGVQTGVIERSAPSTVEVTGIVPTVASGATDCGTSPAIAGNNTAGVVTVGTSTNGGKCTVTFQGVWRQIPHCFCNNRTAAARSCQAVGTTNTTNATTALTAVSTLTAGDILDYICLGHY